MTAKSPVELLEPHELVKMVDDLAKKFKGQGPDLESAIGMLFLGRAYGWRVLYLMHSRRTVDKYEKLLGIETQKFFPERTALSKKSLAYVAVEKLDNFWKAVKGEYEGTKTRSPLIG